MTRTLRRAFHQLAGLYGVQTAYDDARKRRQRASDASLLAVLQQLGAPIATFADVPSALRERQQTQWQRSLEPVLVAWENTPAVCDLRMPVTQSTGLLDCHLQLETGDVRRWEEDLARLPSRQTADVEGAAYLVKQLRLPKALPWGYHQLMVDAATWHGEALVIVAPRRAYALPGTPAPKSWGVFLPLYALHSERSWGCGDFADLQALVEWVGSLDGDVVATLPLLSAFLDEPCDPSPYTPASRLFWNEFYIDVTRAPGLQECAVAQALLTAPDVQEALATLRAAPQVDYRSQMALKRRVLQELADFFFTTLAEHHTGLQQYMATHPMVEDYARFRATGEHQRAPWPDWPAPLRDGALRPGDYDEAARRYHLYVQWVAHEQLCAVGEQGQQQGVRLYLDLPLGVHAHSYDVWRQREVFARGATVGAPPDAVFAGGQNWGFPPLHPEALRTQGYQYMIAYLRHQLRHAGIMRIDHVMGLHRLFWIPPGGEASQGVYVRYAADELYAILTLESHRHQVRLVGENLGTVPGYVNTKMDRHHLQRMYVVQYALSPTPDSALSPVSAEMVASLNTHDMAPFAAYWQGLDIRDLCEQGLFDAAESAQRLQERQALLQALQHFLRQQGWLAEAATDAAAVMQACLAWLSASPAQVVLANLEDLWLETQPQNFPGTAHERPNWQHKARYNLETLRQMPAVRETLQRLNRSQS